jgi:hypothetical protein
MSISGNRLHQYSAKKKSCVLSNDLFHFRRVGHTDVVFVRYSTANNDLSGNYLFNCQHDAVEVMPMWEIMYSIFALTFFVQITFGKRFYHFVLYPVATPGRSSSQFINTLLCVLTISCLPVDASRLIRVPTSLTNLTTSLVIVSGALCYKP